MSGGHTKIVFLSRENQNNTLKLKLINCKNSGHYNMAPWMRQGTERWAEGDGSADKSRGGFKMGLQDYAGELLASVLCALSIPDIRYEK